MSALSRQASQELTRKKLRKAALSAFSRKGVAGVGIEQIARDAGFSRGAFYANYASKLDILIDITRARHVETVRQWRNLVDKAANADDIISELAADFGRRALAQETALLTAELQLEADRNDAFRPVYQSYLDELFIEIRTFFTVMLRRHGKAPPADLDTKVATVRALTFALGSVAVLGSEFGQTLNPEAIMGAFLRDVVKSAPPLSTKI